MADDKTYIIDPLTSLCKIALLHFMPEKTKLAINHHVLYIQGYSYYQWLERTLYGDSRIDISNLNMPLVKAIKWYILEGNEKAIMDKEMSDSIRKITYFTILGLTKLQDSTYNNDIAIKIILQYFINLLKDALNNAWKDENCIKIDNNNNNILSDKIKNNFETDTINSIAKMLVDADKMKKFHDDVTALIDCAHQLLINRDIIFVKLMQEVNTTL
jgi:hypothetical protein